MAKVSVTVRLDQELIDRLDDFAQRAGMTRTDVVERSILAGIKEGESHLAKLENPIIRGLIEATLSLDGTMTPEEKAEFKRVTDRIKSVPRKRSKRKRKPGTT